jgi:hypothetical protein
LYKRFSKAFKTSNRVANLHLFRAKPKKILLSDAKALRIAAGCIHILPKTEEVGLPIGENIKKKLTEIDHDDGLMS